MSFKIQISKKAEIEINQSIDWYNEQKIGLGKQFYSKIKAIIKVIRKKPKIQQFPFCHSRCFSVYCCIFYF
ncbi:MAG: hypothetical protein A2033_16515 [Bacteroidetes bacterium GWA2_31_9]|nr:MAG: hypothetical protein A2033_16515 [Bacteroidetes bacterium GWA2_31_9]